MREDAVLFGAKQSLVGIVTEPARADGSHSKVAVILLNAGIVHRVGPGRIYVKIARALAAMGFVVFRFDFSGIGDSTVRHDHLCFEKSAVAEAQEAMEFLNTTRGIEQFVLLGGCSGAYASFQTACNDSRVAGIFLINFQMAESEDAGVLPDRSTRNASHYYWNRALFNLKSWHKLLTGKTDYTQIIQVLWFETKRQFKIKKKEPEEATHFRGSLYRLAERRVQVIFVCSNGDPLLRDLREMGGRTLRELCRNGAVILDVIRGCDHTFSSMGDQERLLKVVCKRISAIHDNALTNPGVTIAERAFSSI